LGSCTRAICACLHRRPHRGRTLGPYRTNFQGRGCDHRPVYPEKRLERQGFQFALKHIDAFQNLWNEGGCGAITPKFPVSDLHRTIVDILDDPALGGGIQHVSDCLNAYLKRADRDDQKLIEYGEQLGNGAVFKRLGFLAERNQSGEKLTELCRSRLSAGNAKLDPALVGSRLVTKWRLFVPDTWIKGGSH